MICLKHLKCLIPIEHSCEITYLKGVISWLIIDYLLHFNVFKGGGIMSNFLDFFFQFVVVGFLLVRFGCFFSIPF